MSSASFEFIVLLEKHWVDDRTLSNFDNSMRYANANDRCIFDSILLES